MPRLRPFVRVRRPACSRALSVEAHKSEAEKFPRKLCRKWRGDRKSMYANLRRTARPPCIAVSDGRRDPLFWHHSLYSRVKVYLSADGGLSVRRPPARRPTHERGRRSDAANKSGRMTEIAANVFPGMGMPTERGGGTRRTDGQTIPSKQKG